MEIHPGLVWLSAACSCAYWELFLSIQALSLPVLPEPAQPWGLSSALHTPPSTGHCPGAFPWHQGLKGSSDKLRCCKPRCCCCCLWAEQGEEALCEGDVRQIC